MPVRTNRDDRYFGDVYQAMPLHGFTRMFENMLDHSNIKILLNADYREIQDDIPYREMIYTGPVDEFFDYRFGKLPYRSLEFRHETKEMEVYQDAPVVNYPNTHAYTRITEFKYLTGQVHPKTSIVFETPRAEGDPHYPVPRPQNAALYAQYKQLADVTPGAALESAVGRVGGDRYAAAGSHFFSAARRLSTVPYAPGRAGDRNSGARLRYRGVRKPLSGA